MKSQSSPPIFYNLTHHIQTRQQQRGISRLAIKATLDHGRVIEQHTGTRAYYLGRKELVALARISPALSRRLRPHVRTTVIVSNRTGALVTTYRCSRPSNLRRTRS